LPSAFNKLAAPPLGNQRNNSLDATFVPTAEMDNPETVQILLLEQFSPEMDADLRPATPIGTRLFLSLQAESIKCSAARFQIFQSRSRSGGH
jgi:hypothetical protein